MNMKRFVAYLLTLVMMFTTIGPAFAEDAGSDVVNNVTVITQEAADKTDEAAPAEAEEAASAEEPAEPEVPVED